MTNQPNVILLSIDALRKDAVSSYGSTEVSTPNLDSLFEDGIQFENAIAHGSATVHSFHSMMKSILPRRAGDEANFPLLAQVFNNLGYSTAACISNPFLSPQFGFDEGFDHFVNADLDGIETNAKNVGDDSDSKIQPLLAQVSDVIQDSTYLYHYTQSMRFAKAFFRQEQMHTPCSILTENISKQTKDVDEPLFLWSHFMEPHSPYFPNSDESRLSNLLKAWKVGKINTEVVKQQNDIGQRISRDDVRTAKSYYENEMKRIDTAFGKIIRNLKNEGLYDDSLIVVWSDHGEEFFEHGRMAHSLHLYDELIQVPLLIKPPSDVDVPDSYEGLFGLMDIYPTILSMLGEDVPDHVDGYDFSDAIWNGQELRNNVISQSDHKGRSRESVRTKQWKYIRNQNEKQVELYDLEKDPGEETDISADEADVVNDLEDVYQSVTEAESKLDLSELSSDSPESVQNRLEDLGYL